MNSIKSALAVAIITIGLAIAFNQPPTKIEAEENSPVIIDKERGTRHRLQCRITSLNDVLVEIGNTVSPNEAICVDSVKIRLLESRQAFLEDAIASPAPVIIPKTESLPLEDFSKERAALTIAQARLTKLEQTPVVQLNFYDPNHSRIFEPAIFNAYAAHQESLVNARYDVVMALANLEQAKIQYQQAVNDIAIRNASLQAKASREQKEAIANWESRRSALQAELFVVVEEINSISRVITPFEGEIAQINFLPNEGNIIPVEIILISR